MAEKPPPPEDTKNRLAFHFALPVSLADRFVAVADRLAGKRAEVAREAVELYLVIAEAEPELRGLDLRIFLRAARNHAIDRARAGESPTRPHPAPNRPQPSPVPAMPSAARKTPKR